MFYYTYFRFTGTYVLADALGGADPFALSAEEIVEHVISAGYTPLVDQARVEPLNVPGRVSEVLRGEQRFVVHTNRDMEVVTVEEVRRDMYDPVSS